MLHSHNKDSYKKSYSPVLYLIKHRPVPGRAPYDARPGTGRCLMSQTATGEKRRVFAEELIAFT